MLPEESSPRVGLLEVWWNAVAFAGSAPIEEEEITPDTAAALERARIPRSAKAFPRYAARVRFMTNRSKELHRIDITAVRTQEAYR